MSQNWKRYCVLTCLDTPTVRYVGFLVMQGVVVSGTVSLRLASVVFRQLQINFLFIWFVDMTGSAAE
jgi:hypothetical protein